MTVFFFQGGLMTTARKGIMTMFSQILAPLGQGAVCHSQFTGNLSLRFLTGLQKANGLNLKLFRVRLLLFLHDTGSPLWDSLFRVYSLHKGGPWSKWPLPFEKRFRLLMPLLQPAWPISENSGQETSLLRL